MSSSDFIFLMGALWLLAGLYLVSVPLMLMLGGAGFIALGIVKASRETEPAAETDQQ